MYRIAGRTQQLIFSTGADLGPLQAGPVTLNLAYPGQPEMGTPRVRPDVKLMETYGSRVVSL
jgi:hypothetical protein